MTGRDGPRERATPIRRHAVIGDGHTAALVALDGRVDWWCAPRFDSPPVYDAILGGARAATIPLARTPRELAYVPDTNVLEIRGEPDAPPLAVLFMPYPRQHESRIVVLLRDDPHPRAFALEPDGREREMPPERATSLLEETTEAWRGWLDLDDAPQDVKRSLLVLKLLTYEPGGSVVAAPTTSLPEVPGGERNWDYRYAWIRDTAFCAQAYARWGKTREAHRIAQWLVDHVLDGDLRVLYRIDGGPAPDETLADLPGHEGSRPVRFGNGAIRQFQIDAYGHLIETLDVCHALDAGPIVDAWPRVRELVGHVLERWREPDNGIWEIPAGPRQHVYSKVMAWLAVDRALRIAREHGLDAPVAAWERAREEIHADVMARGVHPREGSFVASYGDDAADAANLRIPLVGFVDAMSREAIATLDAVERELAEGALVRRYRMPDGLPGEEGAFVACSFWRAELQHAAGLHDAARRTFEDALDALGPLGLFPEEIDPRTGAFRGNHPQAISHAAHLCAAHALSLAREAPRPEVRA